MTKKRFEDLRRTASLIDAPLDECLDEVERLRGLIVAFCKEHDWAAPAWKSKPEIKALFDEIQTM